MNKLFFKFLYLLGVLITLVAAGIAIWPDLEAQNFSQTFRGKNRVTLSCPVAITESEESKVSLNLRNPLTRRARFAALSFITTGNQLTRPAEERQEIYIEPKGRERLDWEIDQSNSVYGYMVLARVYVFRSGSAPSVHGTCGIWMFSGGWATNSGLRGQTIYLLFMGLGLLSLIVGGIVISETKNPLALMNKEEDQPRLGLFVTAVVLLSLILGLLGTPMAGIFAILLVIIILVSMIERPPE